VCVLYVSDYLSIFVIQLLKFILIFYLVSDETVKRGELTRIHFN